MIYRLNYCNGTKKREKVWTGQYPKLFWFLTQLLFVEPLLFMTFDRSENNNFNSTLDQLSCTKPNFIFFKSDEIEKIYY